jgi:hypothetical protein
MNRSRVLAAALTFAAGLLLLVGAGTAPARADGISLGAPVPITDGDRIGPMQKVDDKPGAKSTFVYMTCAAIDIDGKLYFTWLYLGGSVEEGKIYFGAPGWLGQPCREPSTSQPFQHFVEEDSLECARYAARITNDTDSMRLCQERVHYEAAQAGWCGYDTEWSHCDPAIRARILARPAPTLPIPSSSEPEANLAAGYGSIEGAEFWIDLYCCGAPQQ